MLDQFLTKASAKEFPKIVKLCKDALGNTEKEPFLWVGAGLSRDAGYPSWGELVELFRQELRDVGKKPYQDQYRVVDQYVREFSETDMRDILNQNFGNLTTEPTALHSTLVRLPWAGIITTNYDPLIENACTLEGVDSRLITIQANLQYRDEGMLPIYKIHGSYTGLDDIILAQKDYKSFKKKYAQLFAFLQTIFLRHSIVYVGYGMEDETFLKILKSLKKSGRQNVRRSYYFMKKGQVVSSKATKKFPTPPKKLLDEANHHPIRFLEYDHLAPIFKHVLNETGPSRFVRGDESGDGDTTSPIMEFDYEVSLELEGGKVKRSFGSKKLGKHDDEVDDFLDDNQIWKKLEAFKGLASQRLADKKEGQLNLLAREIGDFLFANLIPEPVKDNFAGQVESDFKTTGHRSRLKIISSSRKLMSLPWELIHMNGEYPVKEGKIFLARETTGPGRELPDNPAEHLKMLVMVTAPEGQPELNYELESARLSKCLDPLEKKQKDSLPIELSFTELGELSELRKSLIQGEPQILHISGHGNNDVISFENEDGDPDEVSSERFVRELRSESRQFGAKGNGFTIPLLYFLSACHSAGGDSSFAFSLSDAGAPAVVGFQWAVNDPYATTFEEHFYNGLSRGNTVGESLWEGRVQREIAKKDREKEGSFDWATAALYIKGNDRPLVQSTAEARITRWERVEEIQKKIDPIIEHPDEEKKTIHFVREGFTGRRRDIRGIRDQLKQGHRFLVISGPGGVGKTTLAGRLLDTTFKDHHHVVLLSNIASMEELTERIIESGRNLFGDEFGMVEHGEFLTPEQELERAVNAFSERQQPLLLYWDNFEDYLRQQRDKDFGEFINESIEKSIYVLAGLTGEDFILVITSRYPFKGCGQSTHTLRDLSVGEVWRYCRFLENLNCLSLPNIMEIHKKIGGHPRALDLLDSLTEVEIEKWQEEHFPKEWRSRLEALGEEERLREEWAIIKPSVSGVKLKTAKDQFFNKLWNTLSSEAKELLLRASVYRVPFGLKGLKAQWPDGSGFEMAEDSLWKRSFLLKSRTKQGAVWYTVYPTTQEFVRKKRPPGKREIILLAHSAAAEHFDEIRKTLGNVEDIFEARHHYMLAGKWNDCGATTLGLMESFFFKGYRQFAISLGKEIVEKVKDKHIKGKLLGTLGMIYEDGNEFEAAESNLRKALSIFQELVKKDRGTFLFPLAITYEKLGTLFLKSGDFRASREMHNEALKIRRKLAKKDPDSFLSHVSSSCNNLGLLLQKTGDHDGARKMYDEALHNYRELDKKDPGALLPDVAMTCNNLGVLLVDMDDFKTAIKMYDESLKIRRKLVKKDPGAFLPDIAATCNNYGILLARMDAQEAAREMLYEALKIRRKLAKKDPDAFLSDLAGSCNNMGSLLADMDDFKAARKMYNESLKIRRKLVEKDPGAFLPDIAKSFVNFGRLLYKMDDFKAARKMYDEALHIHLQLTNERPITHAKNMMVMLDSIRAFVIEKNFDGKIEWVLSLWDITLEIEGNAMVFACKPLGDILFEIGEIETAAEPYYLLSEIFSTQKHPQIKKKVEEDLDKVRGEIGEKEFDKLMKILKKKFEILLQQHLTKTIF